MESLNVKEDKKLYVYGRNDLLKFLKEIGIPGTVYLI
jgi:hypothetical protein